MAAPDHVAWLEDTGEVIETADGREAEIWVLQHADDPAILSAWATHYRQHYCRDEDLPDLVANTGLSSADFLTNIKFPDAVAAPGPSTRAGDFSEILVADFIEYVLGYWCPRQGRFEDRENRNVPTNGTDVIGFRFAGDEPSPDDELLAIESKAGFRPTKKNRLQQAINDSGKDLVREAMSLSAIKQRLLKINRDDALKVGRFQNQGDKPPKQPFGCCRFQDVTFAILLLPLAQAAKLVRQTTTSIYNSYSCKSSTTPASPPKNSIRSFFAATCPASLSI